MRKKYGCCSINHNAHATNSTHYNWSLVHNKVLQRKLKGHICTYILSDTGYLSCGKEKMTVCYRTYSKPNCFKYHMRAIISRGLYIFYPISKDHFFVVKEVFSENSVLMNGLYSRAAYDGARTVSKSIFPIYVNLFTCLQSIF